MMMMMMILHHIHPKYTRMNKSFFFFLVILALLVLSLGFIQSDSVRLDNHEMRILALESAVFTPTPLNDIFVTATAAAAGSQPTPTPEIGFSERYRVLRTMNVRLCPSVECGQAGLLYPPADVEIVQLKSAEGFVWGMLLDGNWVAIRNDDRAYLELLP